MSKYLSNLSRVGGVVFAVALTGCASVTITPNGEQKLTSEPTYESSEAFYFWGLTPDVKEVNVSDICPGNGVRQMQAQNTFMDGLLGAVTFGIYAPRSVKVWCE